ncbi:MAG: sulfatase [bacterium]|nr:sulfatase [bacterium]
MEDDRTASFVTARRVLVLAGMGIGVAVLCWSWMLRERPISIRPNVLLVVLDTTRADYLSCYRPDRRTTPRIDALAAQGTRYSRAYATNFWTLPSHATILTGLYPTEVGATSETNHLPESAQTIAERLAAAGYQTGAVVCNPWLSTERGFAQGFEMYTEMWRRGNMPGPLAIAEDWRQPAADRAVEWIDTCAAEGTPFFLFINFNIAHLPYTPPPDLRARYLSRDWSADRLERAAAILDEWSHVAGAVELNAADLRLLGELYAAEVALADEWVGRVVGALESQGILDQTLVMVTADHGENLGDYGMIGHALSMYDTTLHVPLVVRYPARFKPGAAVDELISLVDLTPTILDVCGLGSDDASERMIRRWSWCSPEREPRDAVFAENGRPVNGITLVQHRFPDFDTELIDHPIRTLRTDEYKLVWHVGVRTELFNLSSVGGELHDVGSAVPEVRDELLEQLEDWAASLDAPGDVAAFESQDPETLNRLRGLGYVR